MHKRLHVIIKPAVQKIQTVNQALGITAEAGFTELKFIIIDDGSTDDSGTTCDSYAEQDSRIRVFHTENRGLSAARNLGLDEARV